MKVFQNRHCGKKTDEPIWPHPITLLAIRGAIEQPHGPTPFDCSHLDSPKVRAKGLGWPSLMKETRCMSTKNPECPLYNPLNCKEYYNPKLCAFVRPDKACIKKKKPKIKQRFQA
jgi:hypothetical protein